MKKLKTAVLTGLIVVSAQVRPAAEDITGFTAERQEGQRDLEARFDAQLKADNLRRWMERLTAHPHHVGSAWGRENAEFMASLFRSWGYQTEIEEYRVLFPTPRKRVLEMIAPQRFRAALREPPVAGDRTSSQQDEQLPSYNAYSVDGNVSAELVYVNYGIPADYEILEQKGIDVKGKIVIARYGGSWRGIKPKVAAEKGAVGCILYSDPRDDGHFQGDVYPRGPFRNESGVQRGSVADMPLFPGDPLTPGRGATAQAERLEVSEAPTLTRIPVLPISHSDALPLLRQLAGPVAPAAWRGALPVTYHLGPGPARVHLELEFNWDLKPAYNVAARIPGTERPDQWIIRGNHHDAWVNGAQDPISGMVATLEEARAIAELVKQGWKPKRTIIYAAWDAEEPGLLGSTEWAEHHAGELLEKAAVYINSDSNGRGFLRASGSHTLEKFINEVARAVEDPQTGVSVLERARARRVVFGSRRERSESWKREDLPIGALGSGSDYTPFLQHLGVASLNLGFGGENRGGSYHSIYDSLDHYTRFGDPGFQYGVALAKVCGRAVLRLAGADVLPFEFKRLADTVSRYVEEVKELADNMRRQTEERNRLIENGWLQITADPQETFVVPQPKPPVPHLNFAPLENALERLARSARSFEQAAANAAALSVQEASQLDKILYGSERALTGDEGLPGRSWFRHFIYAPGFYTGYGVKTLPAVRETIEQREWDRLDARIEQTARRLEAVADQIERAVEIVRGGA